jgi:hypothetical protein
MPSGSNRQEGAEMGFWCECGYAWKGTKPETRQHQGEYLSVVEQEKWQEEVSRAIASFVQASASGLKDKWFDDSGYFNSVYPRDQSDEEIIHDLVSSTRLSWGVDVYRCPECQRVYIQEASDTNWWMKYQYAERIGTP